MIRHCAIVALGLSISSLAIGGGGPDPLGALSDEFTHAGSIQAWSRVEFTEGWNATHLEVHDVNVTTPGAMTLVPYTTSWYENYRGPFVFKLVEGDFVLTTEVTASGRDGVSVPQSQYSLAGVFIRAPRDITPGTWAPG